MPNPNPEQVCAGERERVKEHLRILFKQGEGADEKQRVDARIKRVSRRFWKRMCRWEIGAPQELARDLLRVYDFFKNLIDPTTGRSFFGPDHAKRCAHELAYVAAGYLILEEAGGRVTDFVGGPSDRSGR